MPNNSDKKVILRIIGAAVVVFILVFLGIIIFDYLWPATVSKNNTEIAVESLESIIKDINVNAPPHPPGQVVAQPSELKYILPEINKKYPPQVNNSTPSYIEIFSSPEKAGSGTDGWLTEVARDFNNAGITIDGKQVSVRLRGISSGEGADYITSGKYLPDAYTPSNELWGEMIRSCPGVKVQLVQKRLAGNVAGILLNKTKKDELINKYGPINIRMIADVVTNKELRMGYTDPFYSSTGLNFLISALETCDSSNLLSDKAKAGFESFQHNIHLVALTTLQMRDSAKSGNLDGFVLEYQTYMNDPVIRSYEFIPFGVRHDSPMYAIGDLSAEKMKILSKFVEFTQQEKYQTLATKYGFNGLNGYQPKAGAVSGDEIIQAQGIYKEKKNTICAVFVADVSGSMDGEPLNRLKRSLIDGQCYIGSGNLIGLVSYSNDVHIDLPIARFNANQRSKFAGAVKDLQSGGSTATNDAIAIAMKMLIDQKAAGLNADPNLNPRMFVLSDGYQNEGHSLDDIEDIVKGLGITIHTIGYNADIPELKKISDINEGACINADTEDVVYKLRNLFNTVL